MPSGSRVGARAYDREGHRVSKRWLLRSKGGRELTHLLRSLEESLARG